MRSLLALIALGLALGACAKSTEDDESEETTTTTTTTTSAGGGGSTTTTSSTTTSSDTSTLPVVTLTIPTQEQTALHLQEGETKTVLERTADRANTVIEQLNAVIAKLNVVKLPRSGEFSGKLGFGGALAELPDDPVYDRAAVICLGGAPVIHVKYDEAGTRVRYTRDFGVRADLTESGNAFVARVVYDASGDTATLDVLASGKPFLKPRVVTDGDYLVDHVRVTEDSGGGVTVSGVEDWRAAADTPPAAIGDAYLVGRLDVAGDGEFVGYRKFEANACPEELDETAEDAPGWCLGRTVGASAGFSDDERAAAWERLQDIGITSASTLELVTMDSDLACPASSAEF
jgi:hypothetical protein